MAFKKKSGKNVFIEPEAEAEGGDIRETLTATVPERKKTPASRVLLLLLLLVAVAGAGYYYLIGVPEEAPPPRPKPAAPVKQAIAIPPPPAPEKMPVPAPAAPKPAPSAPVAAAPAPPSNPPAAAPAATAKASVPPQASAPSSPVAAVPSLPAPAPAPTPAPKAAVTPPAAPAAPSAAPATPAAAKYTLEAGMYLLPDNRLQAEKVIRRLGYEPRTVPVKRTLEMVRLLVGVFPPEEAKQRLQELAGTLPDAFTLPRGDQVALYAASYFDLDRARSFADRIYQQGIRVEEETAQVPMTLQRVTFGSFADKAAAGDAAAKVRAAGLEAAVIRKQ